MLLNADVNLTHSNVFFRFLLLKMHQKLEKNERYKCLQGLGSMLSIRKTALASNALSWIGASMATAVKISATTEIKRETFISRLSSSPKATIPDWSNQLLLEEDTFVP